jgi:Family of unknown function (DUF5519)
MFNDYRLWVQLQLSAGGLPANILGYVAMLLVKLIAFHDLRNPASILPSVPAGKYLQPSEISERSDRPTMHKWPVPQRQVTLHPSASEFALLQNRLQGFISGHAENSTAIRKGKSFDSLDAYYFNGHELFHIHPVDKSLHCMLHPSDAKLLIEKGWAEWFGLAGRVGQGKGTVFVYAVRGEEEMNILEKIWGAAIMFAMEVKGV